MIKSSAITLLAALCVAPALSLPRFALTTGTRCSACHVNPGGGGMRTQHGLTFGVGALTMAAHGDSSGDREDFVFDPRINDNITLGADFRTQFLYLPDTGQSTFHMMTASLYGDVRLTRDISACVRFDLVNTGYGVWSGPEVYVLARVLPGRWYIKGGDFLPAYGTRIDDHTGYTRGGDIRPAPGSSGLPGLLFVPNYKDIGLEIGGAAGNLEIAAGIFNGSGNAGRLDFRDGKAFTARLEYAFAAGGANMIVGSSGYVFDAYRMGGFHAGIGTETFALYGEVDFRRNRIAGDFTIDSSPDAMAAFAAAEYRVSRGVWATAKYDIFDPARGSSSDEFTRITLGLELFPVPFIELRPQFRIASEHPSVGNNSALLQLHAWF